MPEAVVKLLRAQLTPLAENTLPEPADLEPFWDRTKRALLSLDQSFSETNLVMKCGGNAVANLGPLIIGAVGWQQIKGKHMSDWSRFTKAVEEAFGLTRQQLEDQFFALEPQAGEGSAAFVVRAEVARRKLGVDSG